MEKLGMLKLDLYIALVCFLFPLGWTMSGFRPNVVAACICWGITISLLIHAFWVYERTGSLNRISKTLISLLLVSVVLWVAWSPVRREYHREHFSIDAGAFIRVLKSQFANRALIRIGCTQGSEDSCVYAGQFVDLFREGGWRVEDNSVKTVRIGKPEAGILFFLHGTGVEDPNNPKSGLWVEPTESLQTVRRAFREIGLTAGDRADKSVPEGVIAIYFGYRAIAL
jgi:hypothetical protein